MGRDSWRPRGTCGRCHDADCRRLNRATLSLGRGPSHGGPGQGLATNDCGPILDWLGTYGPDCAGGSSIY